MIRVMKSSTRLADSSLGQCAALLWVLPRFEPSLHCFEGSFGAVISSIISAYVSLSGKLSQSKLSSEKFPALSRGGAKLGQPRPGLVGIHASKMTFLGVMH